MKRILLAVFLALLPLGAAHGQDPEQRIQAAKQRARAAGIPVALLDNKVAEGQAKGIPADRIATAVERRLDAVTRALEAMGRGRRVPLTVNDLSVGADALEAGVEPAVLGRLTTTAPSEHRAAAIFALTELVKDGVASERALQQVNAAIRQGGGEALRSLPGESRGRGPDGAGPPGQMREPGARGRGRGQGGGPPASVPGPGKKPERPGRGGGNKP